MAVIKAVQYLSAVMWDGTNTQEVMDRIALPHTLKSDDTKTLVISVEFNEGFAPTDITIASGQYFVGDGGYCQAFTPAEFARVFYQLL